MTRTGDSEGLSGARWWSANGDLDAALIGHQHDDYRRNRENAAANLSARLDQGRAVIVCDNSPPNSPCRIPNSEIQRLRRQHGQEYAMKQIVPFLATRLAMLRVSAARMRRLIADALPASPER